METKPLSIGQVAAAVGVSVETVRYYEREGLLAEPSRTQSRYRQYGEDAVHRLRFIVRAKDFGFTLTEIKGLIGLYVNHSATRGDVRQAVDEKIAAIEAQIRELRATEDALRRLRALCSGDGPASGCPILMTLAGICPGSDPTTEPSPAGDGI